MFASPRLADRDDVMTAQRRRPDEHPTVDVGVGAPEAADRSLLGQTICVHPHHSRRAHGSADR